MEREIMWDRKILCVNRREMSTCCHPVGRQTFVASSARQISRVSGPDHPQPPFPLAFSRIRIFAKTVFRIFANPSGHLHFPKYYKNRP